MLRARMRARHAPGGNAVDRNARAPTRFPAAYVLVAPEVRARFALEQPVPRLLHRTAALPRWFPGPECRPAFRAASRTSRWSAQAARGARVARVARPTRAAQAVPRSARTSRQIGIAERIDSCRPESVSGLSTCPSRLTPLPEPARSSRERNPSPRVPNFRSLAMRAGSIADARWRARLRFVPTRASTGSLIVAVGRGFLAPAATGQSCPR